MDSENYFVSAALLSRGQENLALVADLAARMERSLPKHVEIERTGWGKRRRIKGLTIRFETNRFRIEVDEQAPRALIDQIVRGVCLKSEQVSMDRWLGPLAAVLNLEATRSVEARLAIEEALE
jgi:hypothetical protein